MDGEDKKGNKVSVDTPRPLIDSLRLYLWSFLAVAFITGLGKAFDPILDRINISLLYLLPVLVSAVRWGRGPSLFASFLGVLAFDFFFVPPYLTFAVEEIRYIFVFAIYLLVALVTGTMATRLRDEAEKALLRERRTLALYSLSREIAAKTDLIQVLETFVTTIAHAVDGEAIVLSPETDVGPLREIVSSSPGMALADDRERAVAHWVFQHGRYAGKGTDTLRGTDLTFFPISIEDKTLAVLAIRFNANTDGFGSEQRQLIEAFANLGAVAIIRVHLAKEAEQAQWLAESEKLHAALLNSISHDLRTPLASITGAVTSLLSGDTPYDAETKTVLLQTIKEEAVRMNHFVANLLDMVRLEGGMLRLNKQWCDIQDILGVALRELKDVLQDHPLHIDIPSDLPLVSIDFGLIEHVVINLLENAAKYSPQGSDISVFALYRDESLCFTVTDQSPPVPATERERVFDKFYRLHYSKQIGGTGLGLSICKGIIEAHGGKIWVDPSPEYGNRFTFSLPVIGKPPGGPHTEEGADYGI